MYIVCMQPEFTTGKVPCLTIRLALLFVISDSYLVGSASSLEYLIILHAVEHTC